MWFGGLHLWWIKFNIQDKEVNVIIQDKAIASAPSNLKIKIEMWGNGGKSITNLIKSAKNTMHNVAFNSFQYGENWLHDIPVNFKFVP